MLRWIFSTLSRLATPKDHEGDQWLRDMRQAERYMDAGKFDKAEAILRPLSASPLPDDRRLHILYMLGIALGQKGDDQEASAYLEKTFELARSVKAEDTGFLVSALRNWFTSVRRLGQEDEIARIETKLHAYTIERTNELWTTDDERDDWIHIPTTIRFPTDFGALHRVDVGFDSPVGLDGTAHYALKPPGRGTVTVKVEITDRSPREGLNELSNQAVAMLGLEGADYKEGTFRAGLEAAPTGIRRLWPFFEAEGENWNLETFFVTRGKMHISIFKTCPPGDVIETGESLEQMLAQFDWPRPD